MTLLPFCIVLSLCQVTAALPWLLLATRNAALTAKRRNPNVEPSRWLRPVSVVLVGVGAAVAFGVLLALMLNLSRDRQTLQKFGRQYGALLELQIFVDLFLGGSWLLQRLWPKGGAVARATFREGYRQPMFWLIGGLALAFLLFYVVLPFYTFGEDLVMYKEIGFDLIMLAATVFGVLAAATSISEEIEGRTAVTLMSKPISRRQFILGKFAGIFLCCLLLVGGLGWMFQELLLLKHWFDKMPAIELTRGQARWVEGLMLGQDARNITNGVVQWSFHTAEVVPGLVLSSMLVMVMVAIAVSLATRVPMMLNLLTCFVLFLLANLTPVLVSSTRPDDAAKAGPVQKLLHFTAQLFDMLLPGLELFRVRPTLVDETQIPLGQYVQHVGSVTVYGVLFTTIILLLGLVLFEDRDLA